jgi:hypothetical protein
MLAQQSGGRIGSIAAGAATERPRRDDTVGWPELSASASLDGRSLLRRHCTFDMRAATAAVAAELMPPGRSIARLGGRFSLDHP